MSKINVAIIGAGSIARKVWIPLLKEYGCKIISIVDPVTEGDKSFQRDFSETRLHAKLSKESLQGVDLAFVCSPNVYHVSHASFCLQNGVEAILEKPACFNISEARELERLSQITGCRFWLSSASTERADVKKFKSLVREFNLTDIACIDLSWRRANGIPKVGTWFTDKAQAIGGSGADLGWHLLDVGLEILDYPEVTSAISSKVFLKGGLADAEADWYKSDKTSEKSDAIIEVESQVYAGLMTNSGIFIRCSTAWNSHERYDKTSISLFSESGELSLECTFGFSPHRVETKLCLKQQGETKAFEVSFEENIIPYKRFIAKVMKQYSNNESAKDEYRKIMSLGSAMGQLYNI